MKRDPELDPPKKTAGDAAHALIRAGLSAIPVAGGTAVELFQALVTPPLERRRDTWMREVGEAIQRLESEKKIQLDQLQKDEKFLDTLMQASGAALRTSQEEKRR